jgi:hypothetical protein
MQIRAATFIRIAALGAALSLGACGDNSSELANIDNQIVGNDADPALTSALEDQIMVDPALSQQSNRNAVRPPETPTQAQYPLPQGGQPGARPAAVRGPGAGAGSSSGVVAQAGGGGEVGIAGCGPDFDYNMRWARALPAALPVYPGSRITDAAGSDAANCRARVVTFTTADDWQRVLNYYTGRAARAGYTAEHQRREGDHILAGTNSGAGAFFLIITPAGNGSEVALIAKQG